MNTIKNCIVVLLALSAFSLTVSPAFADGKTDAEATCPGCHGVVINGIQAAGSGGKICAQRTTAEWTATIERMNGKGCGVPAGSIAGIAGYLACVTFPSGVCPPPPTSTSTTTSTTSSTSTSTTTSTTLTPPPICYYPDGSTVFGINGFFPYPYCPPGSSTIPPPSCTDGLPTFDGRTWVCPTTTTSTSSTSTTSTTTTTSGLTCYSPTADGLSYITEVSYQGFCSSGWAYSPPPHCPGGTLSIVQNHMWQCSVTTSSTTSSTTTSSTTTTTLCNTYVNGTTQYAYSGSGSCHSFAIDDISGAHIVRDQSYCKKHMSHYNSKGNHVHAHPHPVCM